jgi:polo-like kinase 1
VPLTRLLIAPHNQDGPSARVIKWCDYSNKYGLGYTLSNKTTGVLFNDQTKMVLLPSRQILYIERKGTEKIEDVATYAFARYPGALQKKVMLLRKFKDYLVGHKEHSFEDSSDDDDKSTDIVFVKKWLRTKHAYIFRLNIKAIQTCFLDNSEVVICTDTKAVTYFDRHKKSQTLSMADALQSPDAELTKRLRYTKEMLMKFFTLHPVETN